MIDGEAGQRRLPFRFEVLGGVGRLALEAAAVGPVHVDRLELEVTDLGTDPGNAVAERYQRRRTRLRSIALRLTAARLEERVEQVRRHLGGLGLTQITARLNDGFVSVRARAADGLAAADLSFRVHFVSAGTHLRALASTVRVHGHLPTPGPVIADRILAALLGATDALGVVERPHARGLCDVEIDLVGAMLWHLLPPSGWRLPAVGDIELVNIRVGRSAIEATYGPAGTRSGELGVRPQTHQLAAAHDLMHSADHQLREGHFEDAMRGYRALLAAGGPEQPLLLERILALAAARPAWFFDGLELSRQALTRWPQFPAAHAALASITLAQGDAREAAGHLTQLAQLASGDGDDDQAALAALAGARLLRVLEPKAATRLYELALEHDPGSAEAADSLADRLADEQRWPELVRLVRARAVITPDVARAVQLRLRLADVFVHQLADPASAQQELAVARHLAPDDPAVHEMAATVLASVDPGAAVDAWRDVARLAESRGDHRTCARAWATIGSMLAGEEAEQAWQRALQLDPLQIDALAGLATTAAARGDHATAADLYERLRGLGLPQHAAAGYELELARSLVALGRVDDARTSLRRATMAGGETAAEAHAVLASVAEAANDRDHAAAELDTAIASLVDIAGAEDLGNGERLITRAAELAIARAMLFDRGGEVSAANADWQRAHALASTHAPQLARDAARTMLSRSGSDAATERRWIDAVLATRPPVLERASLLVRRAAVRRGEQTPDLAAALADLHEALNLTEDLTDDDASALRRRAYQLEAELLSQSGDQRARAQALAALARLAERTAERVEIETAAAAAWLAADEPASALPHGARAHAQLDSEVPPVLRRHVLVTLGEAAWRQRAWPDVIRAYKGLLEDPGDEAARLGQFRYRLAIAADRSGDAALAIDALRPLVDDAEIARTVSPELRSQALRLYADLAERSGELASAATALEGFAAVADDSSPTARADAMYKAGELFRRADQADDAIRCLEAALRISELHLPALDALEMAWRERGDLERVSVILGRKVAATAKAPARQKPLLSRLGDLQEQLGRPEVALATHQRALEIDPTWRPSLRFVTMRLQEAAQLVAAAGGLAQLAGELSGDSGVDFAIVVKERQQAALALSELVVSLDDHHLDAVKDVAKPALERAAADGADVAAGLAKVRGEVPRRVSSPRIAREERTTDDAAVPTEEDTASGRATAAHGNALSLRDAAHRARVAGKLDEAFATLETANHVNPGDPSVLQDLVDLATALGDHAAAARHLTTLVDLATGSRKGNALLELAEIYFDRIDDATKGRQAMRAAAEAFGKGARRDATLRMLASESRANLAWDAAVEALSAIDPGRRSASDVIDLATALVRAGRDGDAIAVVEDATIAKRFEDGGALLAQLRAEADRKAQLARTLEERAAAAPTTDATATADAEAMRDEATWLRASLQESRVKTLPGAAIPSFPTDAPTPPPAPLGRIKLVSVPAPGRETIRGLEPAGEHESREALRASIPRDTLRQVDVPTVEVPAMASVTIDATPAEAAAAIALAAGAANRDRLLEAHREDPDDAAVLLALLANTAQEPEVRRQILEGAAKTSRGRALAIALHELALVAREKKELIRAAALWSRAHEVDASYAPVWMPLADALAAADELDSARDLYEKIAASDLYDDRRRQFARERADTLGRDDSIVSGEIAVSSSKPNSRPELGVAVAHARDLATNDLPAAIHVAEEIAVAFPNDTAPLELLELLYQRANDTTAASEAIGRQLQITDNDLAKATLWMRRARLYRDTLDRDAETYRCLKEAHACAPADPEIAYQLRLSAMVRGEWPLAASLLYREIAAAMNPRDRGALHLELALIFDERLDDEAQAQVNYEQALAFDPTIPAAKLPLARRYEALGRFADAARLYEEAATTARPADRGALLEAANRCRFAASETTGPLDLAAQVERADLDGAVEAAVELAHQLWRMDPGHPVAFRVLAKSHRAAGELPALTELTAVRASRAETGEERAAAWLEVARLADELGKLDEAARAYDLALAEDPSHTGALDARGALAFSLGDYAAAEAIYRDLAHGDTALGPDELALRRSIIAEKLGRDTEALTQAQAAAEAAPMRRDLLVRVQTLAMRMGDLDTALSAARTVLDLVPLDDEEAKLAAHFALVDLLRQAGHLDLAIQQLERVLREHPMHAPALELLAEIHAARGDWATATRYLYQLVPLAPTSQLRAERLYALGEAVLVHLGDIDRADDVFLRASDLDPSHVPTLRRLLDVYWRADDPSALVEVATELATRGALSNGPTSEGALAQALVAAALIGDTQLAAALSGALGDNAPRRITAALSELAGRQGRLQLSTASTAVAELAHRGMLDLAKLRAAAAGTPVADVLS